MTMSALVEIKNDTAITTALQQYFDFGICRFERLIQIFDSKMKLGCALRDFDLCWRNMGLQQLNRSCTFVVENQEAFDFDSVKIVGDPLRIYRIDRPL